MLNQKFINKLLTLAMLSICSSVVNASDNNTPVVKLKDNFIINKVNYFSVIDNNSSNSTSNSDKNSKNSSPETKKLDDMNEINNNQIEKINLYNIENNSKIDSKNTINEERNKKEESKEIPYDPDKMWFNYQKLFDKTKNIILKKDNNKDTGIEHADFMENDLARDAVFGTDDDHVFNYDKCFLDEILNCNVCAYYFALGNCFDQIVKMNGDCEENSDEMKQLELNYKYFLALVVSFSEKYNDARMEDYMELSGGFAPNSICEKTRNIKKMNLFEIISPLISKNNNVLVKN